MRPFIFLFALFIFQMPLCWAQGVTIGSNSPPDPSAVLDLQSNQQGFLPPRLTQSQRNAIQNPAQGLMIFNTTSECVDVYFNATGWQSALCNCTTAPAQPAQISYSGPVCAGSDSIMVVAAPVQGAASYQWTTDPGITLTSGQGNDTAYIQVGNSTAQIHASAQNFCGNSANTSLTIQVNLPNSSFTSTPSQGTTNSAVQFSASQSGLNYQWLFTSGTPASSVSQNPSVTWSQAGTYPISLVVTDNAGCTDTNLMSFVVTNCPPPGSNTVTFNFTGGSQSWTVPNCATTITIDARGAQGGNNPSNQGGLGARMVGTFQATPGQVLTILVGGQGSPGANASGWTGGGGGGGTGVLQGNNILVIAGGGGGAGHTNGGYAGTSSQNGSNGYGAGSNGAYGGSNGANGGNNSNNSAGGGLGYNAGVPSQTTGYHNPGGWGCGGGGGGSHTNGHAGGGGGGYSGGGAAWNGGGGGGGSINNGTNPSNSSGFQTGHGQVIISY